MIALLYVLFFAGYLVISIWVVRASYRFAKTRYQRGWTGGLVAAFAMYNLVFWDLIPVLVMHKHYCETEAGFWVYKTPEQWVDENPGVVGEDWTDQSNWKYETLSDEVSRSWPSSRLYIEYVRQDSIFHAITRKEETIVDAQTEQQLSRAVEIYRGGRGSLAVGAGSLTDYKIWLGSGKRVCGPDQDAGFTYDLGKYLSELIHATQRNAK